VAAWGNNSFNQSTVPDGLTGVVAIASGWRHSLALKADGTIVGWGDNSDGQLPQPEIGTQPIGQATAMGLPVKFTVTASGMPTWSYQWRRDGTDISGATSSDFNISSVQKGDACVQ
jgi:hypothetical protein